MRVSEIRVNQIRVNQGLGVTENHNQTNNATAENEERYLTKKQSFSEKKTFFVGYFFSFLAVCFRLRH